MRIPLTDENIIGKVAVCSIGRPAIIVSKGEINKTKDGLISGWEGLGLDGKGTWFSTNPCVIAESGQEFHDKLLNRFGGKMSYHS